jgi:ribonuclease Z
MKFEVTILGSSSATPIFNRNPTSQVLNINERLLMIDCGEGTQQQMLRYGIKYHKIEHIFISHLHGDHFFGLVGLISSMNLNGRKRPLHLFGPEQLMDILNLQFKHSDTHINFPIEFKAIKPGSAEIIFETYDFTVETIPLNHRVSCSGFVFREKQRLRKVLKEKITELEIPANYVPLLKRGIDFTDKNGKVHKAIDLTIEADEPKAYAYCSDTVCDWTYINQIYHVDTLYHEATFMHDMVERAKATFHTTCQEAGEVAKKVGAKKLLIGHFSARYRDLSPLLIEARSVFPESYLANEGETFVI